MMLKGAFPAAKTTESTSQVYETMLADLDWVVAQRAVTQLIATSRFLPSIAEIREVCATMTRARIAAAARERFARRPALTMTQLAERDRHNRAGLALVVSKGAQGVVTRPAADAASGRQPPPCAPADLLQRILAKKPPLHDSASAPRKWTAAGIDAELAKGGV
jgi:hypothetical protein